MRRLPPIGNYGLALTLPLALSLLWVPVRSHLPNTALALLLVFAVLALGGTGRRGPVLVAAASAGLSFDYFNTRPFEHVVIERWLDLETTLALVVVSAVAGELAVRVANGRRWTEAETRRAASIGEAASLLAAGEELVVVIQQIGERLVRLLGLRAFTYRAGPGDEALPLLERDGRIVERGVPGPPHSSTVVLQIWGHAQVLGHYLLELAPGAGLPGGDDLAAAVVLADQVGAAVMTQAPPPPDPAQQPLAHLHVVR